MNKLWDMGTLVQIQARVWAMEAHLDAKDINKEQQDIPDFVRLGFKRLFSKEVKNNFSRIVGKARNSTQRAGFNFFLTGAYFVPNSTLPQVVTTLDELKGTFAKVVDSFMERYEFERDSFLNKYPEHRANLAPFYPPKEDVRSKFGFNVYCYKISSSALSTDEAVSLSQTVYVDWATKALNELRQEARELAMSLKEELTDDTLNGRSMRRAATLVARLSNLDLSKDVELLGAAKAVAVEPTTERLSRLHAAAADWTAVRTRKLLFD